MRREKTRDEFIELLKSRLKVSEHNCWEWQGATLRGYGKIYFEGKLWSTHRISYTLFKWDIPSGLFVCHFCDNKKCCNPFHLFIGTGKENMQDASIKKRLKGHASKMEANCKAVLTRDKVLELRALYKKGNLSYKKIGKLFGVSESTAGNIIRRDTWREV